MTIELESLTYQKSLDSEPTLQFENSQPVTRLSRSVLDSVTDSATSRLYPAMRVKYQDPFRISPVPGGEYHLPGYGEVYPTCGRVKFLIVCERGCNPPEQARHHCDRKECPSCYPTWATRRARVAANKLESGFRQMGGRYRPRHVIVSLPDSMLDIPYDDYQEWNDEKQKFQTKPGLRHKMLKTIQDFSRGSYGGTYVSHPWRFVDIHGDSLEWKHCNLNAEAVEPIEEGFAVYSPHGHFIMFGWLAPSDEIQEKTGIVVKVGDPLPHEPDVFGCVRYQLTHCGVDREHHAIRWFGNMSYNNFVKVSESIETEYPRCLVCDGELWAYSVEGDLLERYSLLVTRYHYRFKPKQRTLVSVKRVKRGSKGSLVDSKFRSLSNRDQIEHESHSRFKALEGVESG